MTYRALWCRGSRLFCLPVLLLMVASCVRGTTVSQPPGRPAPEELIRAGTTIETQLQNRTFRITPLEADVRGQPMHALEIIGDGMMVSFAAQTPPHVPVVRGDAIEFGGHTFQVTAQPNQYVVNGTTHVLQPGGIYLFNEGQFALRYR
jgi:hypothetical protein